MFLQKSPGVVDECDQNFKGVSVPPVLKKQVVTLMGEVESIDVPSKQNGGVGLIEISVGGEIRKVKFSDPQDLKYKDDQSNKKTLGSVLSIRVGDKLEVRANEVKGELELIAGAKRLKVGEDQWHTDRAVNKSRLEFAKQYLEAKNYGECRKCLGSSCLAGVTNTEFMAIMDVVKMMSEKEAPKINRELVENGNLRTLSMTSGVNLFTLNSSGLESFLKNMARGEYSGMSLIEYVVIDDLRNDLKISDEVWKKVLVRTINNIIKNDVGKLEEEVSNKSRALIDFSVMELAASEDPIYLKELMDIFVFQIKEGKYDLVGKEFADPDYYYVVEDLAKGLKFRQGLMGINSGLGRYLDALGVIQAQLAHNSAETEALGLVTKVKMIVEKLSKEAI